MTSNEMTQPDAQGKTLNYEAGRRAFMRTLGMGAVGAAIYASSAGDTAMAQASGVTEADVFNFALNLEYLEAEFYLRAAFGRGLADADTRGTGTLGAVSGGRQVTFTTNTIGQYARELARDEEAHVKLLRSALGSAAVARPAIDINASFTALARGAGIVGPTGTFDPYASEDNFLLGAFVFEDVGVTAYKGAVNLIRQSPLLEAAAGLLAVEAYHAGIIRTVLYGRGLFTPARQISDLRDFFDGPSDIDFGIGDASFGDLVPNDTNGLAFSRTPAQVLAVVYASGTAQPGGFFPNGMNGTVR